ncbi:MAG: VIT1/CCC1 transporter family protein [Chloroflexaceae bacterium]|nr:VIT1/CCC1 transporter family protein [Chloroflexaceae bacterium]
MTESNQPFSSDLLAAVEKRNREHRAHRAGWLRAAVLGANDGLVSTASLLIGIVAAGQDNLVITAGIAGITAGAMSMAVGEYVSVSSQTDIEIADKTLEIQHQKIDPVGEELALTAIYVERGLSEELARAVAKELHAKDALKAHLMDELGQNETTIARPVQAALASSVSFIVGGMIPHRHGDYCRCGTTGTDIGDLVAIGYTTVGAGC